MTTRPPLFAFLSSMKFDLHGPPPTNSISWITLYIQLTFIRTILRASWVAKISASFGSLPSTDLENIAVIVPFSLYNAAPILAPSGFLLTVPFNIKLGCLAEAGIHIPCFMSCFDHEKPFPPGQGKVAPWKWKLSCCHQHRIISPSNVSAYNFFFSKVMEPLRCVGLSVLEMFWWTGCSICTALLWPHRKWKIKLGRLFFFFNP